MVAGAQERYLIGLTALGFNKIWEDVLVLNDSCATEYTSMTTTSLDLALYLGRYTSG